MLSQPAMVQHRRWAALPRQVALALALALALQQLQQVQRHRRTQRLGRSPSTWRCSHRTNPSGAQILALRTT